MGFFIFQVLRKGFTGPAKQLSRRGWCVGRWPGGRFRKRRAIWQSLHLPAPLVKLTRILRSVSRVIARRVRTGGERGGTGLPERKKNSRLAASPSSGTPPEVGESGGKSPNWFMGLGKSSDMEERALGPGGLTGKAKGVDERWDPPCPVKLSIGFYPSSFSTRARR